MKILKPLFYSSIAMIMVLGFAPCGRATTNPENTLPRVEQPLPSQRSPVTLERTEPSVEPDVQRLLATRVQVDGFDLRGARAVTAAELDDLLRPLRGRSASVGELVELARKITGYYQERNYPLSFAYVPAQSFANHVVRIQLVEGYVGKLKLEGDFGGAEEKVRAIIRPMLQERPLTRATMSRYSSLLGFIPGLSIQAYLPLPQNQEGVAELLIRSTRQPITATGRIESLSPKTRGLVSIQTNAHSPLAEQLTLTTLLSEDDEEYYAVGYGQMLGNSGLMLKLDGAVYDGRSDEDLPSGLRRDVLSLRLGSTLSYPFIAERGRVLTGTVGISAVNFEDRISNGENLRSLTSKTRSRALLLGANYSTTAADRSRSLQFQLSKGLRMAGSGKSMRANYATTLQGVNPADLGFSKLNLGFYQSDLWRHGIGTVFSMSGQYSPDNLPVTERVQFGGFQYGRAYGPGFIFGDSGWGASGEVNRMLPAAYDLSYFKLVGIQPYGLLEAARTYQNDEVSTVSNDIRSLAMGVRFRTDVIGVADVALAKSLTNHGSKKIDDLTLSLNFGFVLH